MVQRLLGRECGAPRSGARRGERPARRGRCPRWWRPAGVIFAGSEDRIRTCGLWVMSQSVAFSPNPFRLKRAAHADSPGVGITPNPTISVIAPCFVHKSVHNAARIRSQRGKEQVQHPVCHGRESGRFADRPGALCDTLLADLTPMRSCLLQPTCAARVLPEPPDGR